MDECVEIAVAVAAEYARRTGLNPGDVLGRAWERCRAAPTPAHRRAYALYGCRQERIALAGVKPKAPRPLSQTEVPANSPAGCGLYGHLEPADRPPNRLPPTRLELWAATRAARAGWAWPARVWLYLHAVEGVPAAEAARCVGRSAGWAAAVRASMLNHAVGEPGVNRVQLVAGAKRGRKPADCCRRGHPFTPETTGRKGADRYCLVCRNASRREVRAARTP